MNTSSEVFWVQLVASILVGLCVLAILVIALRDKRRTGKLPDGVTGKSGGAGWFGMVFFAYFVLSGNMSEQWLHKFPFYFTVPGLDLALFLGTVVVAGYALARVFSVHWSRHTSLWISYCLLFPALTSTLMLRDYHSFVSTAWIWILAGLIALFMTPILARLTYAEFYLNRADRVD
ncbi:MAG TPA: hypothetical protein VFI02_16140 [Armatimonadota bacterium]|nr:hypothetical protein [Armatimonadota bacterium]